MNLKYKFLFKNIGILTISNFGSKILVFFLIPLYTSVLSTAEYGQYDLFNTVITLIAPILTINISEAVLRFTLDRSKSDKEVFSIGLKFIVRAIFIFVIFFGLNYYFKIIDIFNNYFGFLIIMFVTNTLYQLISKFARGLEKVLDIAIAGIINSVVVLSLNILFLVVFKLNLLGYFLANILSMIISILYLSLRINIFKYISFERGKSDIQKEMIDYSVPLILSSISWWIIDLSDRWVIIAICGIAANGVYSVAYKIPMILNVFQTVFNQAWVLSTVKLNDEEDGKVFISSIYKLYGIVLVIGCSVLIASIRMIARILFAKEFYTAWMYAPFLIVAVIFSSLSGCIEGIFVAKKATKINGLTTAFGAAINLVLNIITVHAIGPLGAAISTFISSFSVWLIRVIYLNKHMDIQLWSLREIFSYLVLVIQVCFIIFETNIGRSVFEQIALVLFLLLIYSKDIKEYSKYGRKLITKSR